MRIIKIFLTATALAFALGTAPATASADSPRPTETAPVATTCHESGLTFYCKTIQSGPIPCPDGWVCLYTDANFRGMLVRWPAGNHHPNFGRITCESGGASVNCPHGGPGFDDEASSWANFTNRLYCINWFPQPVLPNNDMPAGSQGNIGGSWNDQASALSSSGC